MTARRLYFAFGMNMAPSTMGGALPVGGGYALDWRLAYRGFADIERAPGEVAPGVVWDLDDAALARLDAREGYQPWAPDDGLYTRGPIRVQLLDGEIVSAVAYWMTARTIRHYHRGNDGPGSLSDHYIDLLWDGREAFGLPTDDLPARRAYDHDWGAPIRR